MRTFLFNIIIVAFLAFSCRNNRQDPVAIKPGKEQIEELNRFMIRKDRERIENYIERKGLKMKESPTGFWYQVTRDGNGPLLSGKNRILLDYDCSLLDGTPCYSSRELGQKEVILGRTAIEPGLDQGLRMLRPGSEAIFILPPFLAYGLPGDGKKIPPRSVLVYNVRISVVE